MYPNLKLAIFKRGLHQNHLAKAVGINEAVLSKIIRGYREPSATLRRALAEYLQMDEEWLFEEFSVSLPTFRSPNGNSQQERKDGDS
jgi:transcriptional regulator with XRE-family HTH domain